MEQRSRTILVADSDPSVRCLFQEILGVRYVLEEAANGHEAIDAIGRLSPELIFLDVRLPGIDWHTIAKQLPVGHSSQLVVVSDSATTSERARALEVGAEDYLVKPLNPADLQSRVELNLRLRERREKEASLQRQIDLDSDELAAGNWARIDQTIALQDVAVFTLAKVAESRDNETGQHISRMREYSQILARELQRGGAYADEIDGTFLADFYRSSPLHDIGKVGIPDSILLKPGRLTPDEFDDMKRHTTIGGNILHEAVMGLEGGGFLSMAVMIAQFHHERWDGGGYPAGLIGDEIPLAARIVSVADVYDALTSERPYKKAWSNLDAKQAIDDAAGTQFDPVVVAAFNRCFEEILVTQREYADGISTTVGANSFLEYDLAEA